MAVRVVCRCSAARSFMRNGSLLVRQFSSYDERHSINEFFEFDSGSNGSSFEWPDTRLGPLEPKDRRFPMPGLVGPSQFNKQPSREKYKLQSVPQYDADILVAELPHERQSTVFEQFLTVNSQLSSKASGEVKPSPFDKLECVAHDCPFLLRKDFLELFPNCDVYQSQSLTVIAMCQRMQSESKTEQQNPNKELLTDFIAAATDICQVLHSAGYWADFMDPSSGRPFIGDNMNASSYEVDERYRHFGFEIDDSSGQCRVLRHHALGTRPFIGCIFTSAPVCHPLVAGLTIHRRQKPSSKK